LLKIESDKNKKEMLGVDIDEVVADFMGSFLDFYNSVSGKAYKKQDITRYELWKVLNCTQSDLVSLIYEFHKTPFFKSIKPIEGSTKGIAFLKSKYRLHAITSRQKEIVRETTEWIEYYFKSCFESIEFTDDNALNRKLLKKSSVCNSLGITTLIEDRDSYAEECANKGIRVILLDRPWNRKYKEGGLVKRVYG